MEKYIKAFMVMVCFLLLLGTANAQNQYLIGGYVIYDNSDYPEFYWDRGGAEGHSGATIYIMAAIDNYNDIKNIDVKAKHVDSHFEVSLVEVYPSCFGTFPSGNFDVQFGIRIRPEDWMTGEWKIMLKYKINDPQENEEMTVIVPRFNFPPVPTGLQITNLAEETWLVWNRIGNPSSGPTGHVEYLIVHFTTPPPYCHDQLHVINSDTLDYVQLLSGNRIAFKIPDSWGSGDLIRIENRIYDDNDGGVYRWDRGIKYFFLP